MDGTTIEVCGVPDILPEDRMVDKLTIHFLRPKHGGGEVLRVIYPTSTKGQAFVVFELNEVAARVAHLKQTLDIDGQQFPLTIEIADRLEVDLPVQASLDLQMFPDQSEVHRLLKKHSFKVTEFSPGKVLLEGTFLNLRAVRFQLQRQLHEAGRHTSRAHSVSASANGTSSSALPKNSSKALPHKNGSYGYMSDQPYLNSSHLSAGSSSVSRSPLGFDSSSASSDQSLSSSYHSRERQSSRNPSYLPQDSGAPQSLPNLQSHTSLTSKPPLQRGTLSPRETSLEVDSDAFHYIWSFKKDIVHSIFKSHRVEVTPWDNSEITTLTLKGKDCEGAKQKLQDIINVISSSLRVQEIPLSGLSHEEQVRIQKRIQTFQDLYKVVVRESQNSVKITGSSADSYEMKQQLLGKPVALPVSVRTGRNTERGPSARRSSSVPKQQKLRLDQDSSSRLDSPSGSASQAYSPSRYQDDKHLGGAAMVGSRRRTNSESREKTRTNRPMPRAEPQDMTPSSGTQMPPMKKNALNFLEMGTTSIKNKWKDITNRK